MQLTVCLRVRAKVTGPEKEMTDPSPRIRNQTSPYFSPSHLSSLALVGLLGSVLAIMHNPHRKTMVFGPVHPMSSRFQ